MKLDFLTPGSWEDSYSSRLANPNMTADFAGGYRIRKWNSILACCRDFLKKDPHYFELFKTVELYVDSHYVGTMTGDGIVRFAAPSVVDMDKDEIFYPLGNKGYLFRIADEKYLGRD